MTSHAVPEIARLAPRILDQLSLGVVITSNGAAVYCNSAFESMSGLSRQAIEGAAHPYLRPGHVVNGEAELRAQLEPGAPFNPVRVRYERDDGFPAWNEIQIVHEGEYAIWIHRDLTQQMATHELWQRYAFLVDSSRQFMALVDRDYNYELVNQAFARLFHRAPDEINGASGASVWGEALFKNLVVPCLDRCFQGEEVQKQQWVVLPGGNHRYLNMVYTPYRGTGEDVRHAVFVAWDNTEEKRATDTVSEMNRVLEQRVEERTAELQDKMRELEAFNYTIAHDLRSPLRFLKSFAEMLEEESGACLGESGQYYCNMITQGVAEMQHLLDRLLDFAQLSRKPISLAPCDLNAVVAAARDTVLLDRSAAIRIDPLPTCLGESPLLKQVFVNLLSNAVKFTHGAANPRIEVFSQSAPPGQVHICVRDNGIGFHMNHAEAMFAPFKQVHETNGAGGSGLGLAIVRRIVERHGGRVWAEGREGRGATIHVLLAAPENSAATTPIPASTD
ncbi:MAG: PAS domain-containing protein [Candidatus Hydrogenedentes bacterium]|nr:PAS domain-containing protein [Candidatus Hydrogenedentota bacterium]